MSFDARLGHPCNYMIAGPTQVYDYFNFIIMQFQKLSNSFLFFSFALVGEVDIYQEAS